MKNVYTVTLLLAFLIRAAPLTAQTDTDQKVISSFYQNGGSNCASIALIKAAMSQYGYNKIFEFKHEGGKYKVTLRNNQKLTVTDEELALAKTKAQFGTENTTPQTEDILLHAYLAYACIAKYIAVHGYWGCVEDGNTHYLPMYKFEKALRFITKTSYCTDNAYRLLGFSVAGNEVKDFNPAVALPEKGVLLYSLDHAVVVYKGQLDCYGNWLKLSDGKLCNQEFKWYLQLQ